jgi:hypothetical protein
VDTILSANLALPRSDSEKSSPAHIDSSLAQVKSFDDSIAHNAATIALQGSILVSSGGPPL